MTDPLPSFTPEDHKAVSELRNRLRAIYRRELIFQACLATALVVWNWAARPFAPPMGVLGWCGLAAYCAAIAFALMRTTTLAMALRRISARRPTSSREF